MRTYAQIANSARDDPPFSNATEGDAWTANWCDKCGHDAEGPDNGCPILLVGLLGKTPAEWLPGDRMRLGATYRCSEFRKSRPRRPAVVDIPGQLELFSEDP